MSVDWGFDYGFFDTLQFDETPQTGTFQAEARKTFNKPRVLLWVDGLYFGHAILSIPQISISTDITAGFANVKVTNTDQFWNVFIEVKLWMGLHCEIGLYFSGIAAIKMVFSGTIEEVRYEGASAILRVRDKMTGLLQKRLGNGQEPFQDGTIGYNPAGLVWIILTDTAGGGLDDRNDVGNEDIDYTNWSGWWSDCATEGYTISARFTGQTVKAALQEIAELTNSCFWIDGAGRFKFEMFGSPYSGTEEFDASNCESIDLLIKKDKLCNYVVCRYGYSPADDEWGGFGLKQDSNSQNNWGLLKKIMESKIVWHSTLSSAETYAQTVIDKYSVPEEIVKIHSMMSGFLVTLADRIYVTESLKELSNREYWIERVSSNLEDGTTEFEGRKA